MSRIFCCLIFASLVLGWQLSAKAQDTVVPAGTLIRCTLNEPNFSSATASVNDPVVCHLSGLQMYGRNVFPRGSYLGGHLEAAKEPGHFVGKGYLRLTFDRVGFPNSDIPVPAKVIAATGYNVNRRGDIVGRGHATRDTVEWLIPPLWPWKVITLPARGPRPTLKGGEQQITLRLMDDIVIPRTTTSYDRPPAYFRPQPSYDRPPASYRSQSYDHPRAFDAPATTIYANSEVAPSRLTADSHSVVQAAFTTQSAVDLPSAPTQEPSHLTLIALKSGNALAVTNYRVDNGSLNYVLSTGAEGSVDMQKVDWRKTSQLNSPR